MKAGREEEKQYLFMYLNFMGTKTPTHAYPVYWFLVYPSSLKHPEFYVHPSSLKHPESPGSLQEQIGPAFSQAGFPNKRRGSTPLLPRN